jgi:AcrR family transcriptional regulator
MTRTDPSGPPGAAFPAKAPRSTSDTIRTAACRLFAEQGYAPTRIKDIARAVGIQPGGIYNHVTSKHELLLEIISGTIERLIELAHEAVASTGDEREQIRRAYRGHIVWHAQHANEAVVANREVQSLDEPDRTRQIALRDEYVRIYSRVIHRGAASGTFRTEHPHIAAIALLQMGIAVPIWYHADGALTPDDVADIYCTFALRQLGAEDVPAG